MATDCYKFWEMMLTAPVTISFMTGLVTIAGAIAVCSMQIKRDAEKQRIENKYSFNRTSYEFKRACYFKFYDLCAQSGYMDPITYILSMHAEIVKLQLIAPNEVFQLAEEVCSKTDLGEIFKEFRDRKISKDEVNIRIRDIHQQPTKDAGQQSLEFAMAFSELTLAIRKDLQDIHHVCV